MAQIIMKLMKCMLFYASAVVECFLNLFDVVIDHVGDDLLYRFLLLLLLPLNLKDKAKFSQPSRLDFPKYYPPVPYSFAYAINA